MTAEFDTIEVVREENIRCAAIFKNNFWIPDYSKVCSTESTNPKPKVKRPLQKVDTQFLSPT